MLKISADVILKIEVFEVGVKIFTLFFFSSNPIDLLRPSDGKSKV